MRPSFLIADLQWSRESTAADTGADTLLTAINNGSRLDQPLSAYSAHYGP